MVARTVPSTCETQHGLLQAAEYLLHCIERGEDVLRDVKYLRELLIFLPLTDPVRCEAHYRLRNAKRFLASQEPGAAGYELEALVGHLKILGAEPRPSRDMYPAAAATTLC
jgi:hypothetical protein